MTQAWTGRDEPVIDLRSDVVAPPTEEMWEAMRRTKLGWNFIQEDQSVNDLEALGASLLKKEAGLFLPTCSMANLIALMTLGERGTQVVLDSTAHPVVSEEWGLAYVCGLFAKLVDSENGILGPEAVEAAITYSPVSNPPRTTVVCLENSHNNAGGVAVSPEETKSVANVAHRYGASVHLDGARLFNSAAALNVPADRLAQPADTVAISLNKGLSAPEGALLCGPRKVIDEARKNAKRIGAASVHKAGILAAAGIVALTKMLDTPREDNRQAASLAARLAELRALSVNVQSVQTNIVLVDTSPSSVLAVDFAKRMRSHGILVNPRFGHRVRFVTHRLIREPEVGRVVEAASSVLSEATQSTFHKV